MLTAVDYSRPPVGGFVRVAMSRLAVQEPSVDIEWSDCRSHGCMLLYRASFNEGWWKEEFSASGMTYYSCEPKTYLPQNLLLGKGGTLQAVSFCDDKAYSLAVLLSRLAFLQHSAAHR